MKVKGYALEIDGELCPTWFREDKNILREESHALISPYGTAKVVPVNVVITKRRINKKRRRK